MRELLAELRAIVASALDTITPGRKRRDATRDLAWAAHDYLYSSAAGRDHNEAMERLIAAEQRWAYAEGHPWADPWK
jgi:hypothetical protein